MNKMLWVRTIVLIIALVNQSLMLAGWSPLPFDDTQVETAVTIVFSVVATSWAYWKNNSHTKAAKKADQYLDELKNNK
ncbi:phage holin [Heyndrickxia camelliae]|uniref:Phage holin n=1 Tax=Heyndrickxia camelliae TaxID=1707093 RepID=A0A2N3LDH5_9BACI|nr:phage holin [Heyndrickxia camelliae]PKR82597.1 phage holin [Heyndrickxia camelliae]